MNIPKHKRLSSEKFRHIKAKQLILTDHPVVVTGDATRDIQNIPRLIKDDFGNELIGFGLRIKNGINLNRISDGLKSNFEKTFEKNKDKWGKFLTRENNRLRLTKEGYAFADAVAVDFLL